MTTISEIATEAEGIIEKVMAVEPTIAGIAGTFVPPIAAIQPIVIAAAPFVESALKAIAAGNGGDTIGALAELAKHLIPGLPNSPALSPEAPTPATTP